eukprot:350428-Chlamydomonas_euryale.AAC.9
MPADTASAMVCSTPWRTFQERCVQKRLSRGTTAGGPRLAISCSRVWHADWRASWRESPRRSACAARQRRMQHESGGRGSGELRRAEFGRGGDVQHGWGRGGRGGKKVAFGIVWDCWLCNNSDSDSDMFGCLAVVTLLPSSSSFRWWAGILTSMRRSYKTGWTDGWMGVWVAGASSCSPPEAQCCWHRA